MLDLNAHILPGIHSATPDLASALAAASDLVASGVRTAVAPALVADAPAQDLERADTARHALRDALAAADVPLRLLPGAVVPVEVLAFLPTDLMARCTVGDGGRWIVTTLPSAGWPLMSPELIRGLDMGGMGLVIAHPERSESVQASPDRLRDLLGRGALVQLGAGSMRGDHGPRPERTAFDLLRNGMVSVVASDAPSRTGHALDLDASADMLERVLRRPRAEVSWMLDAGPERIAAGEPVRAPRLVPLPRAAAAD
ncbi:MAG: CpsB/CapC family capsule biosynthesis tyrosine phosphatase [Miltoncostaeaceae bacterium]